ncbi:hypothetical protein GMORB2_6696 [Geosmithia morbida]|uniref:Uncharacterized protein n=1 Tax=Geosmithia morbida TaxID=1094350 RepID=A0A9P4YWV3_9HYPO|nr:uncharacterized protein GMORB2_6696 [Geosmithia morbida]KAF4123148.1 hypothetical protein GMORB2_6696 [Geosmithia morbida]
MIVLDQYGSNDNSSSAAPITGHVIQSLHAVMPILLDTIVIVMMAHVPWPVRGLVTITLFGSMATQPLLDLHPCKVAYIIPRPMASVLSVAGPSAMTHNLRARMESDVAALRSCHRCGLLRAGPVSWVGRVCSATPSTGG